MAQGAFPEPKLTLSLDPASGTLEDVRTDIRTNKGSYDVIASTVIESPPEPMVFHCELRIPEAQYETRKTFIYYPGSAELSAESGASCLFRIVTAFIMMLSSVCSTLVFGWWC